MAGGRGTRLRPYTLVIPKPLMPVADMPILEVVLRQLKHYGFERVTITVGHLANLIVAFFGNGEKLGMQIDYAVEDQPRGTIGPLAHIDGLDEPFLVMNGDLLTDLNFGAFAEHHRTADAAISVATYVKRMPIDLGVVHIDNGGRLCGFDEKPVIPFHVSMGIYALSPEALQQVPHDQPFGFDDLMRAALHQQVPTNAYLFEGRWLDIGRKDDYQVAVETFERDRHFFCPWEADNAERCSPA